MSHDYAALHREIDGLRRMRDELRLKAHLGRVEVRELWDDLEKRWNQLEANAKWRRGRLPTGGLRRFWTTTR